MTAWEEKMSILDRNFLEIIGWLYDEVLQLHLSVVGGGNPINPIWSISRRCLCFGAHVCMSSCDSGDAIWHAILHGWRQSSVQESKVRCRLVNKALIGRIDFTWHGFHKDVALSHTPSPPPFLLLSSVVPRQTPSTSPRCKWLYYSTSLCLNLPIWGYPSFWPVSYVWRLELHKWIMHFDTSPSGCVFALGHIIKVPSDIKYGQKAGRFTAVLMALSHSAAPSSNMLFCALTLRLCWWRNVCGLINVSEQWALNALQLLIWC